MFCPWGGWRGRLLYSSLPRRFGQAGMLACCLCAWITSILCVLFFFSRRTRLGVTSYDPMQRYSEWMYECVYNCCMLYMCGSSACRTHRGNIECEPVWRNRREWVEGSLFIGYTTSGGSDRRVLSQCGSLYLTFHRCTVVGTSFNTHGEELIIRVT